MQSVAGGVLFGKQKTQLTGEETAAYFTGKYYGGLSRVGPTVVLMFILMGQLLFAAGGGQFFTDLAMAGVGDSRGGVAPWSAGAGRGR